MRQDQKLMLNKETLTVLTSNGSDQVQAGINREDVVNATIWIWNHSTYTVSDYISFKGCGH